MTLQDPLLSRMRVLQVLEEGTKGDAEATPNLPLPVNELTGPRPEAAAFVPRQYNRATLGHAKGSIAQLTGNCSFAADLISDGTADLDGGLEDLLQSCGFALATHVFSPESVVASQKTSTIYVNDGGVKKQLFGAAGNVVIEGEVGGIVRCRFDMRGKWTAPTDVGLPTPTYPTATPLRAIGCTFTLHTDALKISRFRISLNATVVAVQDINDATGAKYYAVSERDPTVELDPQQDLVANHDFYGIWLAGTEAALSLLLTDGLVNVTIGAPKVQYRQVDDADREGIAVYDLTGQCNSSADAGDDELTLTTAAV